MGNREGRVRGTDLEAEEEQQSQGFPFLHCPLPNKASLHYAGALYLRKKPTWSQTVGKQEEHKEELHSPFSTTEFIVALTSVQLFFAADLILST